jgi:hypothetical protein
MEICGVRDNRAKALNIVITVDKLNSKDWVDCQGLYFTNNEFGSTVCWTLNLFFLISLGLV